MLALPDASVAALPPDESAAAAPLPGAAKCTVTEGTGFEWASCTVTSSACPKTACTVACWVSPPVTVIVDGAPDWLVSEKEAETEATVAETLYGPPATVLAVAETLARPAESVVAVLAGDNDAEAPVAGGAKVTTAPGTTLLCASRTSTRRAAKAVVACACWLLP